MYAEGEILFGVWDIDERMKDCMELYYQKLPSLSPSVCQDFTYLISFYPLPPWQWVLLLLASFAAVERETQGAK